MQELQKATRRVFIGIKMPDEIADKLAGVQAHLAGLPVMLVPKENLHITLMPPWQETDVDAAAQKLRQAVSDFPAFKSSLNAVSYGPGKWRPKLIWATCGNCRELNELKKILLKEFGVRERLPFNPHVTLARLRETDEKAPRRMPLDLPLSIPLPVERVQMFESVHASETGYAVLYDCRLFSGGPPR